ncbi:MAG: ABC transporter substrate-binding protein [Firmicutes bacterium]|jgi:peptide/nickel transport system substrate-binding protein|nr:ABC transporter substrate-binding protein [Bacillota bacterium]
MKKNIVMVLLMLIMLFVLSACSIYKSDGKRIKQMSRDSVEEYRIAWGGSWGRPSPFEIIPRGPGFVRMQLVYDSLVWKDKDGNIIPQLAKKWQYDEENFQYLFELNEGVKWHDGEDFSADDVVFTIEYIKAHKLPWLDLEIVKEAKVINENQVVVSLENHYSPFMNIIASGMPIIPKHIFENVENPYNSEALISCVGCGPYIFKDYSVEHGSYDFEGFEGYYNSNVMVNNIRFLSMNPEILHLALIRDEVDLIMPSHESLEELIDEGLNVKKR